MRYRVLDLPVKGVGAFTPLSTTNPIASSWGLVRVHGSPGTEAIHVDAPTRVWAPTPGGMGSGLAHLQGSNNSPDVILPDKYVAYANNMGPCYDAGIGMATRRRNPLPVPALSWIRSSRKAMTTPKIGGRRAVAWPRAFQRFPSIGSGGNG